MQIDANKMNEELLRLAMDAMGRVMFMQMTDAEKAKFREAYKALQDLRNSVTEPEGATLKLAA